MREVWILAGLVALTTLGVTPARAQARPSSALSCQLQVFDMDQRHIDLKGAFAPFIVRYDAPAGEARTSTEDFSVYDPTNLLRDARPVRLHLQAGSLSVTTDVDGPGGILEFSATDYSSAPGGPRTGQGGDENWLGAVSLIGGGQKYTARGICRRATDVAGLTDEELIVQRAE